MQCALYGLLIFAVSHSAHAEWELNLTEGVTEISRDVYDMHMFVLWICVWIGVVVFGAMIYSMIKHRKSKGVKPATFSHSTMAEIVWTVIPFAILVTMAVPAAKTLIEMEDTSDSDITVKITGHQWKWEYEYLDSGVKFISSLHPDSREAAVLDSGIDPNSVDNYLLEVDNPLVLPVGKKIRFVLTASDVIHAWWVPEFAIKKDAIPGFINEMWTKIDEEGVYRGQCAELCGRDHGFMPIVVHATSESEYNDWISAQMAAAEAEAQSADREWAMDELMTRGEKVYGTYCVACHQPNGQGLQGVFPSLVGTEMSLNDLDGHIDVVLNGKAGTAMQAFSAQLNDADLAAVITYERNAWGNDTGDVIQPSTIKAVRVQ
ncbi:MAG: cytochrome c oxidase subunit II [Gammaproteobacteria bacterium]|nr:cytochrome c oxidase subunit II [Gammaproteobacteria bacterium]MYD76514.1 cytochrome c oxidase subunit II [Gammaproteobacteria bacterium]MYJ51919.1 cytochrome c oxidase subunit II [Gammaproteobacteria bacterium]